MGDTASLMHHLVRRSPAAEKKMVAPFPTFPVTLGPKNSNVQSAIAASLLR